MGLSETLQGMPIGIWRRYVPLGARVILKTHFLFLPLPKYIHPTESKALPLTGFLTFPPPFPCTYGVAGRAFYWRSTWL